MFIITNGTEWVMENPLKQGEYLRTTYPVQAKEFSLKEAKALMNRKGKAISWIRSFDIVDCGSGEKCKNIKNYKGNGKVYIGENDIPFNEDIITNIYDEVNSIKNLYGWSLTQLKTYISVVHDRYQILLNQVLITVWLNLLYRFLIV